MIEDRSTTSKLLKVLKCPVSPNPQQMSQSSSQTPITEIDMNGFKQFKNPCLRYEENSVKSFKSLYLHFQERQNQFKLW